MKHAKLVEEHQELKWKYEREVAAHRANCQRLADVERANSEILAQVEAARYRAEEMVANVAIAFQYLHQVAFPGSTHAVPAPENVGDAVA